MSTVRIEVLIVAPGAGGIAVCVARGAENKRAAIEPAALTVLGARSKTWPPASPGHTLIRRSDRARTTRMPSPALRNIAIQTTAQK